MSNYQEEHGSYILPATETARLKKILVSYTNDTHEQVKDEVNRLHTIGSGKTNTRSVKNYRKNLIEANEFEPMWAKGMLMYDSNLPEYKKLAIFVIDKMVLDADNGVKGIHKPTVAEVTAMAPRATARTKEFAVNNEAFITLDGRDVTWRVYDNNRSVDYARNSVLGKKFWAFMDSVSWTKNTGGSTLYTDEYRRELAGGGTTTVSLYGSPK